MLPRQFAEPAAPTRFVEIVGVTTGARDVPLTLAHHSAVFSLPVGAKVRVLDPLGEPRHIEDFVTVVGRDIDGGWVSVRGVTCVALGDRLEFTPWSEK